MFVLTAALLFVPNSALRAYVTAATFFGVVFLLYQNISLVDFGYTWNEVWLSKYQEGNAFYGILLIVATAGLVVLTVMATLANFATFWRDGCPYYKTNLVGSVVVLVAMVVLALAQLYRSSSILTASFVALVFTYFNGYALASYPDKECNPYGGAQPPPSAILDSILHLMVNVGAGLLTVVCLSVDAKPSSEMTVAGLAVNPTDTQDANEVPIMGETPKDELPAVYLSNYYIWFHLVMAVFSVYLVMIFFDWRDLNLSVEKWSQLLSPSPSAFAIKTGASVLFVLLYVWTLVAPAFFPDRQFE